MNSWKELKVADTDISSLQQQIRTFIEDGYAQLGDICITTFDDNSVLYVQKLVKGNLKKSDPFTSSNLA